MKKIIISGFLALFAFASLSAQNQVYTITDLDGTPYNDNHVYVHNVYASGPEPLEEAYMYFVFHNESNENIRMFGQVLEVVNTDGSMGQFCIDVCYFGLEEGGLYPQEGFLVAPNEYNGQNGSNYILNTDPTSPLEYKIRFFQGDVDTWEEIPNTTFTLTYRYDENAMGVTNVQSLSIAEVYPTVAKGFTNVNLKENAKVQILNAEGRTVKSLSLKSGQSQLNLSGLSAGVYWVTFKGDSGITTNTRIVVK